MTCSRFSTVVGGLALSLALLGAALRARADDLSTPLDPAAGLASLHVPAGFHVELVAAEPLVTSPVAFDWGPDGKLWVAEMIDYPLGLDNAGQAGGNICYLEDTNGDGRYDRRVTFLEGVAFPNGVMAWRDGVLVTAAGEVFFARDTDGDGRADEQKTLFAGFKPGNQQHRVNGPRWGMDGWCYLANGDSGGVVESKQTDKTVDISGRDLRVRPDDGAMETVTGMTQFGRVSDDWGHWFGSNNSNPCFQFVLEDRQLRRNPHVAPPTPTAMVVDPGLLLHPLSVTIERYNQPQSANHYTSACGGTIYRDDLLGAEVAGNYFVCEPSHNLVQRESLSRDGLLFHGSPADGTDSHFLRSTDNWFRPVMCRPGLDGALWVADIYRGVLEHPEYIPDEIEAKLDLRAGADRGRIYRVLRNDAPPRRVPRWAKLTTAELAAALDSPSGTQRDLVQRMILWRNDRKFGPPLVKLARSATRQVVRAQALWTLDGLGLLGEDVLLTGLADREGPIRAQALEIAQQHLATMPRLGPAAAAMADDKDAADRDVDVQLQLAYLLGDWSDDRAAAALGRLLIRHADDPYLTAAALSSVNRENVPLVLAGVLAADAPDPHAVGQLLAIAAAVGSQQAVTNGVADAATLRGDRFAAWQFAAIAATLDEFRHRGQSVGKMLDPAAVTKLQGIIAAARSDAADDSLDETDRIAATGVLGLSDDDAQDFAVLAALVEPQQSTAVQTAAIDALASSGDDRAAAVLLAQWATYSPALAARALDVLLSRDAWVTALLDRLADGTIQPNQLDAVRRQRILEHRTPALRERAATLLAAGNADRQKVIDEFAWVCDKTGDRARGRQVFLKRCAACHRLEGQGFAVGVDLAAVGNKSPQSLLVAILDPNRAIEDRFANYLAITDDGRQFLGVLAAETGESLTLRGPEGKDQVLLRKNIETLQRTGKSLMPEGLERDMTGDDLADVIAYVAGTSPAQLADNSPTIVRPAADGSVILTAAAARIEGPTVRLEDKYKNLGYWGSADDVATWTIALPVAGSFIIDLDYACDDATAGNTFRLAIQGHELTGQVAGTGSWDRYRTARIGQVDLPAGNHTLTFRSSGALNSPLLDLRAIRLLPPGK
jgi:putative membrane-bound dehydrogenase-like protein